MGVDYQGSRAVPRMELGEAALEYIQQQDEFIGTKVLPIFETKKKASIFPAITRKVITREADTRRAPRGNYNRDGIQAKDRSYACEEFGLEGPLDDSERSLYETDFNAELTTVQIVTRRVLQGQERRIAAKVFNPATFTGAALYTDYAGAPWDNASTDVVAQVRASREKVRQNTGMDPRTLICSKANIDRLLANNGIKDAIKYVARLTEAEILNALADILGIKEIVVGKGIYNSAKEGKPFASADIWNDDYALVAVIDASQRLSSPSLGRTFLWTLDSPENATVEQYRDDAARSDIFRVRQHVDEHIIDPYFGHLMKVDA
ncbi:MAG: major capsid protein [Candidatus Omnitrophica bacterium]|nr:major capsid protein [Candidatus Omnitrophota bacterium]